MNTSFLPLGIQFISIFEKNKIVDWEAKKFWDNMQFEGEYNKNSIKVKMYRSLAILVNHKYLEKRQSPNNKKINLYTGTSKIEYLINYQYVNEIKNQLNQEFNDIQEDIEIYECKLNYLHQLISEKVLTERHISKYKKELHKRLNELHLKLEVIYALMNQHEI